MVSSVFAVAGSGIALQRQRIASAAQAIASMGIETAAGTEGAPVRIGALPAGEPVNSFVTLVEAESAYRMNAAVLTTASDMLETLLDTFQPRK